MFRRILGRLRPAVFWSYRRGSLQYDLIVVLILAFIFLTPRALFKDQPQADEKPALQEPGDSDGTLVFWIESSSLEQTGMPADSQGLKQIVQDRSGKDLQIVKTETSTDEAGQVQAYLVYAKP